MQAHRFKTNINRPLGILGARTPFLYGIFKKPVAFRVLVGGVGGCDLQMLRPGAARDKGCCPKLSFILTGSLVRCLEPKSWLSSGWGGWGEPLILTIEMRMANDKGSQS